MTTETNECEHRTNDDNDQSRLYNLSGVVATMRSKKSGRAVHIWCAEETILKKEKTSWIPDVGIHQEQRLNRITIPEEIAKIKERRAHAVFVTLYREKKTVQIFYIRVRNCRNSMI